MEYQDMTEYTNGDVFSKGTEIPAGEIAAHNRMVTCEGMTAEHIAIMVDAVRSGRMVCYEYDEALHFMPVSKAAG